MVQCSDLGWVEMKVEYWDESLVQPMVVSKVLKSVVQLVQWTVGLLVVLWADYWAATKDDRKAVGMALLWVESMDQNLDLLTDACRVVEMAAT